MNNKGFAITGILYTIFALFMMIIFAALANVNFKRQAITTSVSNMNNNYEVALTASITPQNASITTINSANGYVRDASKNFYAPYSGKYIFLLNQKANDPEPLECTTYLKKGALIPSLANNAAITLIPNDCIGKYNIIIGATTNKLNEMYLKEVYKVEDSD